METVIDGVTYVAVPDPVDGSSACDACALNETRGCALGYAAGCADEFIFWLKKDDVRQQVEVNKAFGHQMPLFPEIEPPVTAEEDEAFNDLSKAQKDYIKAIGTDPLSVQVGGDHYKTLKIQPMEYSMANKLDACQHTIIKYVTRFREKGGRADLEKAKHTIDLLIQLENL